jgi:sugar phosphate isomerase/epimerase
MFLVDLNDFVLKFHIPAGGFYMLNIGITSRAYNGLTIYDTIRDMAAKGFKCTELCFNHPELPGWTYNGIGSLDGITPALVRDTANDFRRHGISVTSLGMFTDLRNPDPNAREKAIDYAKRYIELAAEADIPYIASECGFTPGRRGVNADTYESDYSNLKECLRAICLEAEKSNVHLALEACVLDVIPSPRRLKTLIEELEAESGVRLGAMLDPANFLANSDEEGMFYYLKHDISYLHGKDRKINAAYGVNLGDGDIDWVKFMECYIRYDADKPFILEYCNHENCGEIKARAEKYYDQAFTSLMRRLN